MSACDQSRLKLADRGFSVTRASKSVCDCGGRSHGLCLPIYELKGQSTPYAWSGRVTGENGLNRENSMSKGPAVKKSLMLLRKLLLGQGTQSGDRRPGATGAAVLARDEGSVERMDWG